MRRTGAVLASVAAVLLSVPVSAGATQPAEAAAGCVPSALSASGSTDGGWATTILAPGTYLGWTGAPLQGVIWRNGVASTLPIIPEEVNPTGLVVGTSLTGNRAARLQLGGTPQYGATSPSAMEDVNSSGHAVGSRTTPGIWPPYWREALWWRPGDTTATALPGPQYSFAVGIDDLGYKVGFGDTYEGQRRWLIWGPNGTIVRQYGPYAAGATRIAVEDVDDGVVLATRLPASGAKDIALINAATGALTPVPGTSGFEGRFISNGSVVGMDANFHFALWHNGVRYDLPSLPGKETRDVSDLEVYGTTAIIAGFSYPDTSGWFKTPTVWRCG